MDSSEVIKDFQALRLKGRHRFWEPVMTKYNVQYLAEVGVREGRNFKRLIDHNPKLAVAVDIWKADGNPAHNDVGSTQAELDQMYENFKKEVAGRCPVQICREYSFDAVKKFADNYFDFVYVDGDHTYEGCKKDLDDWFPKIKSGGFLVGDDFRYSINRLHVQFGVIEAVTEFSLENHVAVFFLPRWNWVIIKP